MNFIVLYATAQKFEIISPDRNIHVELEVSKSITYAITYKDKTVISPSVINLLFEPDNLHGKEPVITETQIKSINKNILPAVKEKQSVIPDIYTEFIVHFKNHSELHFRVYNDGVAYRFGTRMKGNITIIDEIASFNIPPASILFYPQVAKRNDADIYHTSFEEPYSKSGVDTLPKELFAFTPVLLRADNLPNILITESDVKDYPGMFLVNGGGSVLAGRFAPYPTKEIESAGGFRQKLVLNGHLPG